MVGNQNCNPDRTRSSASHMPKSQSPLPCTLITCSLTFSPRPRGITHIKGADRDDKKKPPTTVRSLCLSLLARSLASLAHVLVVHLSTRWALRSGLRRLQARCSWERARRRRCSTATHPARPVARACRLRVRPYLPALPRRPAPSSPTPTTPRRLKLTVASRA